MLTTEDIQFYEMFSGHGLLYQEFRGVLKSNVYMVDGLLNVYIKCPYPQVVVGLARWELSTIYIYSHAISLQLIGNYIIY